ncbi:MAG: hypothetical protein KDN19_08605, partial [Verrucomicrobiae bacterium]|nr:hypothetical protein [Verrucomicrobiae bacterium]
MIHQDRNQNRRDGAQAAHRKIPHRLLQALLDLRSHPSIGRELADLPHGSGANSRGQRHEFENPTVLETPKPSET